MKLIVGLGNPGKKYSKTRHNLGFMVLEKMAQKRGVVFRLEPHHQSCLADMGDLEDRIRLVQPQTFMNQSGRAVKACKDYWKIASEDIWVVYDDVDLEFGKTRINLGGSSAGHKGIESIIQTIGERFWRIRIGVGKSDKISTDDWVLMNFDKVEFRKLDHIIDKLADYLIEKLRRNIEPATLDLDE